MDTKVVIKFGIAAVLALVFLKLLVVLLMQLVPLLIVLVIAAVIVGGAFSRGSDRKCNDPRHRH